MSTMNELIWLVFLVTASSFSGVLSIEVRFLEDAVGVGVTLPSVNPATEKTALASGSTLPPYFEVHADGNVKMVKPVNFDDPTQRQFKFTVSVRDKTSNTEKRKMEVNVIINSHNTRSPYFVRPFAPNSVYKLGLPENYTGLFYKKIDTLDGAFIYCTIAKDVDTTASLVYSFSPAGEYLKKLTNFRVTPGVGCVVRKGNTPLPTVPKVYKFPVRVTDVNSKDPAKSTKDTLVTAHLEHQPPQLAAFPLYILDFPEKTPKGATVGYVHAVQMQSRYNKMEWSVRNTSSNWPFDIDKNSGKVTLVSNSGIQLFDRNCPQQWHAIVRVKELSGTPKETEGLLTIRLTDKNDYPPFFEQPLYYARIHEDVSTSSVILTVNPTDPDASSETELKYRLVGGDSALFSVKKDPKGPYFGAQIYRKGTLDYEDTSRVQHWYKFQLVASDGIHPEIRCDVVIEMMNVNDEPPNFLTISSSITIDRVQALGNVVFQLQARDKDGSTVKYAFENTNNSTGNSMFGFEIDGNTGIITYKIMAPVTTVSHTLQIVALDQGDCTPACTKSLGKLRSPTLYTLLVKFSNANLNKPMFVKCDEFLNVPENEPIGHVLGKVEAKDKDDGPEGKITFQLKSNSFTDNPSKYVSVDKDTGVLKSAMKFDRENKDPTLADPGSIWITVEATDSGDNPLTRLKSTCTMRLKITDKNDEKPEFLMNGEFTAVMEAGKIFPIGTEVIQLFAHDSDAYNTPFSQIDFEPFTGFPAYLFIEKTTGIIKLKQSHAFVATTEGIIFKVKASDRGASSGTVSQVAEATVKIVATDDKELLPPTFDYNKETLKMLENATAHALLIKFDVNHPSGEGAINAFDLPGKTESTNKNLGSFEISKLGKTMKVQKVGGFDVARNGHVHYCGIIELNSKKMITKKIKYRIYRLFCVVVEIIDVNNMIPNFITITDSTPLTVPENGDYTNGVQALAVLFAADKDMEKNYRTVKMNLKPTKDHENFEFHGHSLYIAKSVKSFDREKKAEYLLDVVAEDLAPSSAPGSSGPNEKLLSLTVRVTDVNDNSPYFKEKLYKFSVSENVKIGHIVGTMTAEDVDEVSKTALTYKLLEADKHRFGIHTQNGSIFVSKPLDFETETKYSITCEVSDGKYVNNTIVEISVLNVNDETPVFDKSLYKPPPFSAGTIPPKGWGPVTVTNRDGSGPASITVTAEGRWTKNPTAFFNIEGSTNPRQLVVLSKNMKPWMPTETLNNHYHFLLRAAKKIDGKTVYSYARVEVIVTKAENKAPPCFDPGTLIGWPVIGQKTALTLKGVDPDQPIMPNRVTFSTSSSGFQLTSPNKIDFTGTATGVGSIQVIQVKATKPSNGKSKVESAYILVQPKSTVAPSCESQTVIVPDITKPGAIFFTLMIEDVDPADRGHMSFVSSTHPFIRLVNMPEIDAVGFILKTSINSSTVLSDVSLIVKDTGTSTGSCTVKFNTTDGLGAKIKITMTPTASSVSENDASSVNKLLTKISVTDSKSSRPYTLSIKFATGNPGIELKVLTKNTAELYLISILDREKLTTSDNDATVSMRVEATPADGGSSQSTFADFNLTVTDVDEAPTMSPLSVAVLTTSAEQSSEPVMTVKDHDTPSNRKEFTLAVQGDMSNLFEAKKSGSGFVLTTRKPLTDLKESSLFVPVKITEGSLSRTVMVKVALTDGKLIDTHKIVDAVVSAGWNWYWVPIITPMPLGSIYNKPFVGKEADAVSYTTTDNKYLSYFKIDSKTGIVTIIGAVPQGNYTVTATVKRGSASAKATLVIRVLVASSQAVQHASTLRITNLDAQHFVLRPKKPRTTGNLASHYSDSVLDSLRTVLANTLKTSKNKVLIISAQEFRSSTGSPYMEVMYAISGSPFYTPSKLNYLLTTGGRAALQKLMPNGSTVEAPIDRCSTIGKTCPYGCVNRIRVNQKDKDITINPSATYVGLKVSIEAKCGCEFKPDYLPPDCSVNACLNGGKCSLVPGTVNAVCDCPMGFKGPRCQKLEVNFQGRDGYVMTESIGSCSDMHLSFEVFLTVNPSDEIFLYDGPFMDDKTDDFILVGLSSAKPYVQISGKKGKNPITAIVDTILDANTWYRLDVWVKHNGNPKDYLEIMIDRCRSVSNSMLDGTSVPDRSKCRSKVALAWTDFAVDRRIDVSSYPLQVGGSNLNKYKNRGLAGSIRRVRVNSKLRNLLIEKQGLSLNADNNVALTSACYESDKKPKCGDKADCYPLSGGARKCVCNPGYHKDNKGICATPTKIMDFKKKSFTYWKLKKVPSDRRVTSASIRFRTRETKVVTLLHFEGRVGYRNQSLELRLAKSRIQMVINLGKYTFRKVTLPNLNVTDGAWHVIKFERALNEIELIFDNGENGNYVLDRGGPTDTYNYLTLSQFILGGARWKRQYSDLSNIEYIFSDLHDSCLTDVRFDDDWVPMLQADEGSKQAVATIVREQNRVAGCANPKHCVGAGKCTAPLVCVPQVWRPLTRPACFCPVGAVKMGNACVFMGVCYPNPCRSGTCVLDSKKTTGYRCICYDGFSGTLCDVPVVAAASLGAGLIALIIIMLLLIIAAILFYLFFVRCRRRDEKLLEDPEDYTRETITPYDEEGAGEEDQDHYDLSYLRKPVMDIRPTKMQPLGSAPKRPSDLGNFLDGRLQDAENDPHGPPQDYSLDYGYEGQGSVVDDLSSLGSGTSDGSQQYDRLHNMGPKFRPLSDLYNNQRNV